MFNVISRRAGAGDCGRSRTRDQEPRRPIHPDRDDLDEPDLYLDFSDRTVRLLRVDLTLEGIKLHFVVTPRVWD